MNAGSTVTLHQDGVTIADPEQVVVESEPYRRLSYTWHTFTPEWAEVVGRRVGFSDEYLARIAVEPRSKVTFEIQDLGDLVKLTVVHDDFEPGSGVLEAISQGWPAVLSSLKTLLERANPCRHRPAPAQNRDRDRELSRSFLLVPTLRDAFGSPSVAGSGLSDRAWLLTGS